MTYRSVEAILEATGGRRTRRILILTALPLETTAVLSHLSPVATTNAVDGTVFECCVFSEGDEELLVVVAETGAGNMAAQAVALGAHSHFGGFDAQLFVGIGGSRKRDAPLGSVVASSQVYWPYGGRHGADGRSARPRAIPSHAQLLNLASKVCRDSQWQARIRDVADAEMGANGEASENRSPIALVAPIVSVEAVQADRASELEALIAHNNSDAHVVEMEGYGAQFAAHRSDIPSIVVRGISDLTHHDKSPGDDERRQPVAARHAAAFAFELLHQWTLAFPRIDPFEPPSTADGPTEPGPDYEVEAEPGPDPDYREAVRPQLEAASAELLSWRTALPDGEQIERPEFAQLVDRIDGSAASTTAVTGDPGAGKSALLATLARRYLERGWPVLAIKADLLGAGVSTENMLQEHLGLETAPTIHIRRLAGQHPVLLILDQLDALAGYLDLQTERLSVLLSLVRRLGGAENVHVVLSSRTFEFQHDVRLRAVSTEELALQLPPWEEVRALLEARGILAAGWPKDAQEVMRTPQALATYLELRGPDAPDAFNSYREMLEHLWTTRVLSPDGGPRRGQLATQIATDMARQETLWLPLALFDDRLEDILALQAAGVLTSLNGRVGFTHQTVFEHVLARSFAGAEGQLTRYVLDRQNSLFVRPKLWVGLGYLRGVAPGAYHQEVEAIWREPDLRDHLRLLLIDFLGSQSEPTDREAILMAEVLREPNPLRWQAYRAMSGSPGWFARFRRTFIEDAMHESEETANAVTGLLVRAWSFAADEVVDLVRENWIPQSLHDSRSWWVLQNASHWSDSALAAACIIVGRTEIDIHSFDHVVATVGADQPEAALRLAHARLMRDLALAREETAKRVGAPRPEFENMEEEVVWYLENDPRRPLTDVIDDPHGWEHLPVLAERAPLAFLEILWPWFEECFGALRAVREDSREHVHFPLDLEADFRFEEENDLGLSASGVLEALRTATERLAETDPDEWLSWAARIGRLDVAPAQRLVAHVHSRTPERFASKALVFLLEDPRRFLLGGSSSSRTTTERLVSAVSVHWSADEVTTYEEAVGAYRPAVPDDLTEPEQRRTWNTMLRRTRLGLLRALPKNRLDAKARRHLEEEERAYPDVARDTRVGGPHWIGPVMHASAIAQAADEDVINAFRALPDATQWEHPRRLGMGGNIQLAREFAEFSKDNPERAIHLLGELEPENGTRAAALALDALAPATEPDLVLSLLHDVVARGFDDEGFRSYASDGVRKLAERQVEIGARTIALLDSWLADPHPEDGAADAPDGEEPEAAEANEQVRYDCTRRSLLWGLGGGGLVPGGSYRTLEALVFIYRLREEYDQLDDMLERHLDRCKTPQIWEQVLRYLPSPSAANHVREAEFVRRLFAEVPSLVGSRTAAQLLARSTLWNADLADLELDRWRDSASPEARQAYGEIVAVASIVRPDLEWANQRVEALFRDEASAEARAGAALTAAHYWVAPGLRSRAHALLIRLLAYDEPEIWRAACEVFRLVDTLAPDGATVALLSALERSPEMLPRSHASFLAQRMGTLLPHEAPLVARVVQGLIRVWREILRDTRTSTALAAPELIDLALTLHRLGPETQEIGTRLFEQLIEIDAWEARQALDEIDNRFLEQAPRRRSRLARRRRNRRDG